MWEESGYKLAASEWDNVSKRSDTLITEMTISEKQCGSRRIEICEKMMKKKKSSLFSVQVSREHI